MRTVLDIPEDLAEALDRHAKRNGRATEEYVLELVRLAMIVEELPIADVGRVAGTLRALVDARNRAARQPAAAAAAQVQSDPVTGLPVIISPPDAPIHAMSLTDALALEQSILEEEDLKRAGLPL